MHKNSFEWCGKEKDIKSDIPTGMYLFKILKVLNLVRKAGYTSVSIVVVTEFGGEKYEMFHRVNFYPEEHKANFYAKIFLKAIGVPSSGKLTITPSGWVGATFLGIVTSKDSFDGTKVYKNISEVFPPNKSPKEEKQDNVSFGFVNSEGVETE